MKTTHLMAGPAPMNADPLLEAELVFEPRFTTKDCGTGLGLYIAQSLMHRCGGHVRLVDEGDSSRAAWARTEFAISVPKVQA